MDPGIGVNLRVTALCIQGGRKYMEDTYNIWYEMGEDLKWALFGIFDGQWGQEAAMFARKYLMERIIKHEWFHSDKDGEILYAIRCGFHQTYSALCEELKSCPKSVYGVHLSGTTASVALFKNGKIYIGHVGDSSVVLGYQREGKVLWKGRRLTKDHKPDNMEEVARIVKARGRVVRKHGEPRVVWSRPRISCDFDDQVRIIRDTVEILPGTDDIPFLPISRSLGALWSFNEKIGMFAVSGEPDVMVIPVEVGCNRCLILGTHGLWEVLSPQIAVGTIQVEDRRNYEVIVGQKHGTAHPKERIDPSKRLVERALYQCSFDGLLADNISVITIMIDPPGPSGAQFIMT